MSNYSEADFSSQLSMVSRLKNEYFIQLMATTWMRATGPRTRRYAMTGQLNQKSNVYSFGVIFLDATPRLGEDKVKQCIDPKLGNNDYPPKAVAKVMMQVGQCLQYIRRFCSLWSCILLSLSPDCLLLLFFFL
ncbi:hypothetical protein BRADI_1g68945v3 [Brachypodium distachyon]|uniref:Protein kinase domain-containing protein n=1 Tax=Brachypodium distachyon TaxID=15368 RepID=A0A0Q3HID9_BRADI|nr:hypothetical protein BRADI_1g68945v3 [Brachypodium distachyon]